MKFLWALLMHLTAVNVYPLVDELLLVFVNEGFHWEVYQEKEIEEQRRGPNTSAADGDLAVVSEGFSFFPPSYLWFLCQYLFIYSRARTFLLHGSLCSKQKFVAPGPVPQSKQDMVGKKIKKHVFGSYTHFLSTRISVS